MRGLGLGLGLNKPLPWYYRGAIGGVNPSLWLDYLNNRYAVNQVPKTFSGAQTFTRSTSATGTSSLGLIVGYAADEERLEYSTGLRGLLMEESRTNSIGNSIFDGADTDPSTLPTNWAVESSIGLTTTVVGTGTEKGQPYIDINIAGTSSDTIYQFRYGFGVTGVAGEEWTSSVYAKKSGGVSTNINKLQVTARERGGSYTGTSADIPVDQATLERFDATHTLASSDPAQFLVRVQVDNTSTINYTFRLVAPQLEKGSFPTSYIPTDGGTEVRATDRTRIQELDTAPWFTGGSSEGTIYCHAYKFFERGFPRLIEFNDGTQNERIRLSFSNTNTLNGGIWTGGVNQALISTIETFDDKDLKVALSYKANEVRLFVNGVTIGTVLSATMASGIDRVGIGMRPDDFSSQLNGVLYDFQWRPNALTQAEGEALTL